MTRCHSGPLQVTLTVNYGMSQSCRVNSGSTGLVLSRNSSSKYTAIVDTDEREDKAIREEVTEVTEVIDKLKEVVEDPDTSGRTVSKLTDVVIEILEEVMGDNDTLEHVVTEDTDKLGDAVIKDTEVTANTVTEVSVEVTENTGKLEEAVTEVTVDAVIEVTRSDSLHIPEIVFNSNEPFSEKSDNEEHFSEKSNKTSPGEVQ